MAATVRIQNLNTITYTQIRPGQIFKYNNTLYMKTDKKSPNGDTYCAVGLASGYVTYFSNDFVPDLVVSPAAIVIEAEI